VANRYHEIFSKKLYGSEGESRKQLRQIIPEAKISVGKGFFDRNADVANASDYVLASTFGNRAIPKDGGSLNTLRHFVKRKPVENAWHLDLHTKDVYQLIIPRADGGKGVDKPFLTD